MISKKQLIVLLLTGSLLLPALASASNWDICSYLDPSSPLYREYCINPSGFTEHASPAGPVQRSANIIMRQVVMPATPTVAQQETREALVTDPEGRRLIGKPRLIAGYLRYESARVKHFDDADIYGGTIGFVFDTDQFSLGLIVPYDYMDYNTVKVHRQGAIAFGTVTFDLTRTLDLSFGSHLSYMHVRPFDEPETVTFDNVNYYGGGLSTTLTWDGGAIVPSLGVMYQYTQDDTDNEHDYSHLLQVGGQLGIILGSRVALSPFVIWNRDVSAYSTSDDIYNFFDAGLELGVSFTETFSLNVGYKKVLGISDVENDMGYLGLLYRF